MRRWLVLALLLAVLGCGKKVPVTSTSNLVERDKDLYLTALQNIKKNRFIAARAQLQVLLETYENSEYSAQAKYAYAESFYRESGHGNLISAESEFRKFQTFFPDHELAADAQMMVAMTHIKQLEKPDRDNTEARLAEIELLEFINKYQDSRLQDEAKLKLRGVQEILAESILGPAKQYYLRRAYPAVVDRCAEILKKYPDFSGTDRVLFLMAETVRKGRQPEASAPFYAEIIRDHPDSKLINDAKKILLELNQPVPDANPNAVERSKDRPPPSRGVLGLGLFKGGGAHISTDTGAASVKNPVGILSIEAVQP